VQSSNSTRERNGNHDSEARNGRGGKNLGGGGKWKMLGLQCHFQGELHGEQKKKKERKKRKGYLRKSEDSSESTSLMWGPLARGGAQRRSK